MVVLESPDWLPAGWSMLVKVKNGRKIKYFRNKKTGQKFYTKKDVIRHTERENPKGATSKDEPMATVMTANESPEWLPHGWIMELKTRNSGPRIGTQYKCYIDPASGSKFYSKPEVSRYLKTVHCGTTVQIKAGSVNDVCSGTAVQIKSGSVNDHNGDDFTEGGTSSKPDGSQNRRSTRSSIAKEKEVCDDKLPINNHGVDDLPDDRTSSKPDGSRNRRSITSSIAKQKKVCVGKQPMNNVMVESITDDEFPPGWIKEIRTRRFANGIKKDPYYMDPISGYVFRSKADALRYLKTGDIGTCAIKPKKRDINDMELNSDIHSSSAGDRKKLDRTTRRRLFGKTSDTSSLAEPKAESSPGRNDSIPVPDATMMVSTPLVEILEADQPKKGYEPKTKDSLEREQGITYSSKIMLVTPGNDILQEEKLPANETIKLSSRETQIGSSKSKNKRAHSLPSRSSKRLSGVKSEMMKNINLNERALRAATRDGGIEANPLLNTAYGALAAEEEREVAHHSSSSKSSNKSKNRLVVRAVPEEHPGKQESEKQNDDEAEREIASEATLDIVSLCRTILEGQAVTEKQPGNKETENSNDNPEKEFAHQASTSTETKLDKASLDKIEKGLEDQAVPEEHAGKQDADEANEEMPESQNSQLLYPFMDSWSDPCLEFAFKTLTGAIPVEENLSIQDYLGQQPELCNSQRDGFLQQPEFVLPNGFQNDVLSQFHAPERSVPEQQLPANPAYQPPGNDSLPSCSTTSPRQSSLETGEKEFQTKVN